MGAEKRSIEYHFGASESVTPVADKVNKALDGMRAKSGTGAGGGGLRGAIRGVNDQAKELGLEGRDSLLDLVRGGGAAAIAVAVGQALQGLPEAVKRYREALKTGADKVETSAQLIADALPVVGELAKGFQSLRSVLGVRSLPEVLRGEKVPTDQELEAKGLEDQRKAMKLARDEHRKELNKDLDQNARRDIDAAFLAPLEGTKRARRAARQDFENTMREIDADASKIGSLAPDAQEAARAKIAQRQSAARIKRREEEGKADREDERQQVDFNQKVESINASARAQELTNLGQDLAAQRAVRDAALDQEMADIERRRKENERQGSPLDPAGFAREAAAARRRAHAQDVGDAEKDRVEQQNKRFSFADMGIQFLQKEVELGKGALSVDVKRLEVQADYARQRAELNELLKKENLDADSRRALKDVLGQLDAQEAAALLNVNRGRFSGGVAPGGEDRFGTGVVAAGRENDPANRIVVNTAAAVKLLDEIRKLIKQRNDTPPIEITPIDLSGML